MRNDAGDLSSVAEGAMADDDVVYPVTGNEDLVVARLPLEDDDDIRDDAVVLFVVDLVGSGSAPIDLDGGGAGAAMTATGMPVDEDMTPMHMTMFGVW